MTNHVVLTVNTSWNVFNFRRGLVSALIGQGYRVTVLAPEDDTTQRLRDLGCQTVHLEMDAKGTSLVREAALLLRIRRHLKRLRPDAVLGFTIKNNVYGALAARSAGIPFIPTVTGLGTAFLSGSALQRVAQVLYRVAFRNCPAVFFQNGSDRALFEQLGLVRATQVRMSPGSGVDLDHFAPRPAREPDGKTVFLFIGRMLADKGVRELVEAARAVRKTHMNIEVRMLGGLGRDNRSAIPETELRAWIDEGVVSHLGETDDVRPHIAAADCIVLPSYREGSPRALIEAAAMAKPVITTDVPGCRDVVIPGESALLCPVRDSQGLAATMEAFLALPQSEQCTMGRAGQRFMQNSFGQHIVFDRYSSALAEAIDRNA